MLSNTEINNFFTIDIQLIYGLSSQDFIELQTGFSLKSYSLALS